MDITDPFVPAFPNGDNVHVELPEQWMSPFSSSSVETEHSVSAVLPAEEPQQDASAETAVPFGASEPEHARSSAETDGNSIEKAKQLAHELANAVQELQQSIDASGAERRQVLDERAQLQDRIQALEKEAAAKGQFVEALITGTGGSLSTEDLESLKSMTDALTQDPDRLTVLFNVVQQASKLATIVSVFSELRSMAEGR